MGRLYVGCLDRLTCFETYARNRDNLADPVTMTDAPKTQMKVLLEDGFTDLTLGLEDLARREDGTCTFQARAFYEGRMLAFGVKLWSEWEVQELDETGPLYWGNVEISSVGAESDAFVKVLDDLYGTALRLANMRNTVSFKAVGLLNDPALVTANRIDMKLFFEHENDERYAEIYLNIDAPKASVELYEKDSDYRRAVMLALCD